MRRGVAFSWAWIAPAFLFLFACSATQDVAGKGSTSETTNGIVARIRTLSGDPAAGALLRIQFPFQEACGGDSLPQCADTALPVFQQVADSDGVVRLDSIPSGEWRANARWKDLGISLLFSMDSGQADLGTLIVDTMSYMTGLVPDVREPALVRVPGTELWTYTDSAGRFRIDGVYPGSWSVSAYRGGQKTYSGVIYVEKGRGGEVESWLPVNLPPPQSALIAAVEWLIEPDASAQANWMWPQMLFVSAPRSFFPTDFDPQMRSRIYFRDEQGRNLPWFGEPVDAKNDSVNFWVQAGPYLGGKGVRLRMELFRDSLVGNKPLPWLTMPWILVQTSRSQVVIHNQMVRESFAQGIQVSDRAWRGTALEIPDDSCRLGYIMGSAETASPLAMAGNVGWWMLVDTLLQESVLFSRRDSLGLSVWLLVQEKERLRVEWRSGNMQNVVRSSSVLRPREWMHLGISWWGDRLEIFVNGVSVMREAARFETSGAVSEKFCICGGALMPRPRTSLVDQIMLGMQDSHGGSPWPIWLMINRSPAKASLMP